MRLDFSSSKDFSSAIPIFPLRNNRSPPPSGMAQVIWNSDIDVYDPKIIPVPVARNIAKYLNIQELLTFALLSRNTYKTANDPSIWVQKLKDMEVWKLATSLPAKIDAKALSSPLLCFKGIIKKPEYAKAQVLEIFKALSPYYDDLQSNKSYNQLILFKDFQTPEEQSQILRNLLRYNKIDLNESTRVTTRDKINGILEIFENALLRELEIHYDIQEYEKASRFVKILIDLKNEQTLIDFFLQKTVFDNEGSTFFSVDQLDVENFFKVQPDQKDSPSDAPKIYGLNPERFDKFTEDLAAIFNEEARIIDLIFPVSIPMMYKVSEELISNQLMEVVMVLIDASKSNGAYLKTVPYLYDRLSRGFLPRLNPSSNVGDSYQRLLQELIDMLYESFAAEYTREEVLNFKNYSHDKISAWNDKISRKEAETSESILKYVKVETKNDFLTSFRKVFTINTSKDNKTTEDESIEIYSEMQAKAKILSENIKSLKEILSPELTLDILNEAKISLNRLMKFKEYSIAALRNDILSSIQEVFMNSIDMVGDAHLRPGFNKAIKYLKDYRPNDLTYINSKSEAFIEPLVLFFDLINMADLMIQMIDIFYKEEMIHKHENSILNPSLQSKKKLEGLVDKYVADGLNVGIDLLMNEIEATYKTYLKDTDYNPPSTSSMVFDGPTDAAKRAVKILDENIDLLVGSADKSIVEVFHQEIAERFFQIIVKILKKSTISVAGAINLISDFNLYYDFFYTHIKTNKKSVIPLFQALKKLGSIYIIGGNESKALGKLVSDLSKFNGIFRQEEIYEFVQRREDWPLIKRDVEKVMYGLSLGDCSIM